MVIAATNVVIAALIAHGCVYRGKSCVHRNLCETRRKLCGSQTKTVVYPLWIGIGAPLCTPCGSHRQGKAVWTASVAVCIASWFMQLFMPPKLTAAD